MICRIPGEEKANQMHDTAKQIFVVEIFEYLQCVRVCVCSNHNTHVTLNFDVQVKYAPKVVITIIEGALDTGRIPIDNAVRLKCVADANPNEITYQWYIKDEMIIGATSSELVTNVYKCLSNKLGNHLNGNQMNDNKTLCCSCF